MPETRIDTTTVADRLRPALLRLARELRRETRVEGVSPGQVSLMVAVKYDPGIGVNDLAARERISPPAMTKQVNRLAAAGLVKRTPNVDDRRRVGLTLTEDGQRTLRRVRSRRTAWLAQRLGALDDDELAAVEGAVEPLLRLLHEGEGR